MVAPRAMRHLPLDGGGWEGVCGAPMHQSLTKLIPATSSSGNVLPVPHTGAVATNERWGISGAREVVPWRVQDFAKQNSIGNRLTGLAPSW